MKWFILLAVAIQAHSASVCEPRKFGGAYGFQLSGDTTISGSPKPVATMGRLEFDSEGKVSGVSSVNFTGFFLGNPVTGTYEAHTDCSLTWSLQDDSGAFQHFAGTMTPDFLRIRFTQTDPGGPPSGLMVKAANDCSLEGLQKAYAYSISGSTTAMLPGDTAHKVSSSGVIEIGDGGNIKLKADGRQAATDGTVQVDSDCITQVQLSLPVGDSDTTSAANFRGVLADGGKEILAIQTDPGTTVTAKFTAR